MNPKLVAEEKNLVPNDWIRHYVYSYSKDLRPCLSFSFSPENLITAAGHRDTLKVSLWCCWWLRGCRGGAHKTIL